jgi:serine/threonine protein kinase
MSSLSTSYDRVGKLGEGTYGIVYKARDKRSQELVALKRMVPVSDTEGIPGTTMREIAFLRELKHPNIVDLKDVVFDVPKLTLVFECCEMDLAKYLRSKPNRQLPGGEIRSLMRQFLQGLAHMHSRSVLHRDLKPHNLLLATCIEDDNTVALRLKVADFGLARIHGIPVKKYRHDAVTLWYRPPDLLMGSIMYGFSMDVWSAGCIFAEMISGSVLFQGKSEVEQLGLIFDMMGYPAKILGPNTAAAGRPCSPPNDDVNSNGWTEASPPQPPTQPLPHERSQSPRHYGGLGTSPMNQQPLSFATEHSALQSMTSLGNFDDPMTAPFQGSQHDPFPSFFRLPSVDALMDKGLATKAKQSLNDPAWRPGFDAWVKKYNAIDKIGTDGVDLLRLMLQLEPIHRITAAEALHHPFLVGAAPALYDPPPSLTQLQGSSESQSGSEGTKQNLSAVWFPPAPLSAYQMLWQWAPFAGEDLVDEDFMGSDLTAANTAVEEAASFMSYRSSQPSTRAATSGVNKIPVPPRRSGSFETLGAAALGGTVIPTTYSSNSTTAELQQQQSGKQQQQQFTTPTQTSVPTRTVQNVQTAFPPGRVLSGSWSTTQENVNQNSPQARRGHNSGMVQLEPTPSEQDASHTSFSGAGGSAVLAISLTKDAFLHSYGPTNSSTGTAPDCSPKKDMHDGGLATAASYLTATSMVSDDRPHDISAQSSPAAPASATTTATPTAEDHPGRAPAMTSARESYNDIVPA